MICVSFPQFLITSAVWGPGYLSITWLWVWHAAAWHVTISFIPAENVLTRWWNLYSGLLASIWEEGRERLMWCLPGTPCSARLYIFSLKVHSSAPEEIERFPFQTDRTAQTNIQFPFFLLCHDRREAGLKKGISPPGAQFAAHLVCCSLPAPPPASPSYVISYSCNFWRTPLILLMPPFKRSAW